MGDWQSSEEEKKEISKPSIIGLRKLLDPSVQDVLP